MSMHQFNFGPVSPFLVLAIVFVIFLVIREFWCWYFKINQVVRLLENIEAALRTPPPAARIRDDS